MPASEDSEDGSGPLFFDAAGTEVLPRSSAARERFVGDGMGQPVDRGFGRRWPAMPDGAAELDGLDLELVDRVTDMPGPRQAEGREWVQSFVFTPNRAAERRQAAQRSLGPRAGWVRGFGQYLRHANGKHVEVLLDEQHGVPVDANVVEDGHLRSHTTYHYERATSGALVKRSVRIERAMPPGPGADAAASVHAVTDISFSRVRLDVASLDGTKGGR
ncbi:MAG: hypothetical protein FJW27_18050 [Acidimicrobiia bacterium]|nr:hypothetical protein [Acidimicrobiia bacterium]